MTAFHTVQGVICREVTNELPVIGTVVVLEATADAQEELVDECLELEEEKNEGDGTQKMRIAEGDPYGCVRFISCCEISISNKRLIIHSPTNKDLPTHFGRMNDPPSSFFIFIS